MLVVDPDKRASAADLLKDQFLHSTAVVGQVPNDFLSTNESSGFAGKVQGSHNNSGNRESSGPLQFVNL